MYIKTKQQKPRPSPSAGQGGCVRDPRHTGGQQRRPGQRRGRRPSPTLGREQAAHTERTGRTRSCPALGQGGVWAQPDGAGAGAGAGPLRKLPPPAATHAGPLPARAVVAAAGKPSGMRGFSQLLLSGLRYTLRSGGSKMLLFVSDQGVFPKLRLRKFSGNCGCSWTWS